MRVQRTLLVLVVDGEALLVWSIAEVLRHRGHTVLEAMDARSARDIMNSTPRPIDVVLLDYRLPDSNDLRLLEDVRRVLPHSGVVLMPAFGTPEIAEAAQQLGVYRVMNKPFDMHDVEGLVRGAYETARRH